VGFVTRIFKRDIWYLACISNENNIENFSIVDAKHYIRRNFHIFTLIATISIMIQWYNLWNYLWSDREIHKIIEYINYFWTFFEWTRNMFCVMAIPRFGVWPCMVWPWRYPNLACSPSRGVGAPSSLAVLRQIRTLVGILKIIVYFFSFVEMNNGTEPESVIIYR